MKTILLFGAGKSATLLIDYLLDNAAQEGWKFIVVDNDMQTVNSSLLPLIGDQIKLNGRFLKLDNWNIVQVEDSELRRISKAACQRRTFLSINEGITICN